MRLWACPQTEGSLFASRKNTFFPNSSSLEMSTPGGGLVSSALGLPAMAAASAGWASAGLFAQAGSAEQASMTAENTAENRADDMAASKTAKSGANTGRGLRIRPLRIETYADQVNSRLATQLTQTRARSYIFRVARPDLLDEDASQPMS